MKGLKASHEPRLCYPRKETGYHEAPVCKSEAIFAQAPLVTKQAMTHKRVKIKQGRIISDSEYVPNVFSSVLDGEGSPSGGLSHDIIKA